MSNGINRAIEAAGSEEILADQLGVSQQFINKSKKKGFLPIERARIAADLHGIPLIDLVRADIAAAMRSAS